MINKSVANISRSLCSGCMMCGDICSKHAISFPLSEGFWYPKVDEEKCVNCGLCSKKCPVINVSQLKGNAPLRCYGAKTKDEKDANAESHNQSNQYDLNVLKEIYNMRDQIFMDIDKECFLQVW